VTDRARYVVVGNPVEHSRSPQIHQAFALQFGDEIEYTKAKPDVDGFAAFADEFARSGGRGMNVTVPFKIDAFNYVSRCNHLAEGAGAVNTITFDNAGTSVGYNTDGVGLLNDLQQRHKLDLKSANIMLLGAGGAARGVIEPLLAASPNKLIVANRTVTNAQYLVEHFLQRLGDVPLSAQGLSDPFPTLDVVINATSFGLSSAAIPLEAHVIAGTFCYDMSYGDAAEFHRWALQNGAKTSVDGLGMLVEQAAESYFIWHAKRPQTDPVVSLLRTSLEPT
jgi:shikimate dehydrogenase